MSQVVDSARHSPARFGGPWRAPITVLLIALLAAVVFIQYRASPEPPTSAGMEGVQCGSLAGGPAEDQRPSRASDAEQLADLRDQASQYCAGERQKKQTGIIMTIGGGLAVLLVVRTFTVPVWLRARD